MARARRVRVVAGPTRRRPRLRADHTRLMTAWTWHWCTVPTVALGALGSLSCRDPVAPARTDGGSLIVTTVDASDGQALPWRPAVVFDPVARRVRATITIGRVVDQLADLGASEDREMLITAATAGGDPILARYSLLDNQVVWRIGGNDCTPRDVVGCLAGTGQLAVDSRRGEAFVAASRIGPDGVLIQGIGTVSTATGLMTRFSGPWDVAIGGLTVVDSPAPQSGSLLVALACPGACVRRGESLGRRLFLFDTQELEGRASFDSEALGLGGEEIQQIVASSLPGIVYVASPSRLARVNIVTGSVLDQADRAARGTGAVSLLDERSLLIADAPVSFELPGSGYVHLYDARLGYAAKVDISTPLGGVPGLGSVTATMAGLAVAPSPSGPSYLRVGSPRVGPLFPRQPARLLWIEGGKVVGWTDLGGFGLGAITVVH